MGDVVDHPVADDAVGAVSGAAAGAVAAGVADAVAAMRSGSDEAALRALVVLASGPAAEVIPELFGRVLEARPEDGPAADDHPRLPDRATAARVAGLVRALDMRSLVALAGGTYDALLALLVATTARLTDDTGGEGR